MAKTQKEKEEHQHRTMLINNSLGEEYRNWYGWPEHTNYGRYVALGEYIVELCENEPHDGKPRRISSGGICAGEGKRLGGRLSLRYVLAAYCLTFDNARVERQTINTGRRRF